MPNYAVMFRNPPNQDALYEYIATYDTIASAEEAIKWLTPMYPGEYEIWQKQ